MIGHEEELRRKLVELIENLPADEWGDLMRATIAAEPGLFMRPLGPGQFEIRVGVESPVVLGVVTLDGYDAG